MKNSLILVRLDKDYCNYLRRYDDKVPFNYDKKELRPFVGVLFKINELMYFAPLSSPKPKHLKMKSKIDFVKINNGKLGAINFNNMLPVTQENVIEIDLNKNVSTDYEKKYNKLLQEQIYWLNRNVEKIYNKSESLYHKYVDGTLDENIAKRCCNYVLLEEKCREYNK